MEEQAEQWMNELGPATPSVEQIVRDGDDGSWAIVTSDEHVVHVEWVDKPPRLVLAGAIECPADADRLKLYASLLSYNHLQEETGGMTMALAGEDAQVMQRLEFLMHDRTLSDFQDALTRFERSLSLWRLMANGQVASAVATAVLHAPGQHA